MFSNSFSFLWIPCAFHSITSPFLYEDVIVSGFFYFGSVDLVQRIIINNFCGRIPKLCRTLLNGQNHLVSENRKNAKMLFLLVETVEDLISRIEITVLTVERHENLKNKFTFNSEPITNHQYLKPHQLA